MRNPQRALLHATLLALALAGSAEGRPEDGKKGEVEVTGTLTDEGVECQALRAGDDRLYTLTGDLGHFAVGDRVRVTGTVAEVSVCQQGTTLQVRKIEAVP